MQQSVNKILTAKEKRFALRQKIAQKNKISLSFTLNIAGFPKSNKIITTFFNLILSELKIFLLANRIILDKKNEINITDDAGNFYLTSINNPDISEKKIKQISENFETIHQLGRLLDIDIADNQANPVSSGKEKKCYYCGKFPAIVCMRNQNHTYTELRKFIFDKIENYLNLQKKDLIAKKLSSIALKSLLYEVSLTPKPGLVDFNNSGSHSDMNYFTFLDSSSALSPFFRELVLAGCNFSESSFSKALPIIRNIGLQMETEMFEATNKINTQKGLIFLLGINLFASGYYFYRNKILDINKYREIIKNICKNITITELEKAENNKTHGEVCFQKYGKLAAGARLEAENGFPSVFDYSLKVLEQNFSDENLLNKEKINIALQKTLVKLMSINNDTNILYRKNFEILTELQILSKDCFNSNDFENKYLKIIKFCKENNISPGGSADLLAITIYVYFIKNQLLI